MPSDKALFRYKLIAPYLADEPPRGQRRAYLERLAAKERLGPDGAAVHVAAETLRAWVRQYRQGGIAALEDKPRVRRGVTVLDHEQVELLCKLKREVPERSLDRIIRIAEQMELVPSGLVRRSTLHRVLQAEGISRQPAPAVSDTDLDRFEAAHPNDLWQSDMLQGPRLFDPRRSMAHRIYLYAFLDDHSRRLLHGRWSFKGDSPAMELVFRRSLQKFGGCSRAYFDNAGVYRSGHIDHIAAELGFHGVVFTTPHRPMGHGKIEKLNQLIRRAFLAEMKASKITTLDELNEAFVAWMDGEYNVTVHGETGQRPIDRWRAGLDRIRFIDEEKMRQAFLWTERRTSDKSGLFSLFGTRYQTELRKRRFELRYDPEDLHEVEVWHQGSFIERVRPWEVSIHRRPRPKAKPEPLPPTEAPEPAANWLGHLVQKRRSEGFVEPTPAQIAAADAQQRAQADEAVVALLVERLDHEAFDGAAVRDFLDRYGPFDLERVEAVLDRLLANGPADLHVSVYLDAIRQGEPT